LEHELVPKHELLSEEEKAGGFKAAWSQNLKSSLFLLVTDPVARAIGAKPGDMVRIIRGQPDSREGNCL